MTARYGLRGPSGRIWTASSPTSTLADEVEAVRALTLGGLGALVPVRQDGDGWRPLTEAELDELLGPAEAAS